MRIKIQDILPYAEYLDFTDPNGWCTEAMFSRKGSCAYCPFLIDTACALNFKHNQHLPQLLTALQAQHPELFI